MPKTKSFDEAKVMEAAANIFRQKGYNGTSIDDVLSATGLSRSSLYDSFGDKHNLYIRSLEYYKSSIDVKLESIDEKKLNGMQKIEALFRDVINNSETHPGENGCLMVNAAAEMSLHCQKTSKLIAGNRESMQDIFTCWLKEAVDEKMLHLSKPAKIYGQFLYNTLCGLRVMSQSGASKTDMGNIVKIALSSIS
jgi:TetR/AcrR family transcriptional regulator, transcriptional repressor for nem operon